MRRESRWRKKPKVDKSGMKFGKLIVVEFSHYKLIQPKGRRPFWRCLCECGNEKIVDNSNLTSGNVKSCGCLHKKRLKELHEGNINKDAAFQTVVRDYKRGAKNRGFEFDLTEAQIKELTQKNCFYCGCSPNKVKDRNGQHIFKDSVYVYNGIDRIDNDAGYMYNNCVTCCTECNWAKGSRTQKEFLNWIDRIIENKT